MTDSQELLKYTKNLNLLFAEDHEELRQSTTEILKNFFNSIDAVDNGDKALELYKENSYDIVLSDIRMPVMNGIELTQKIYETNPQQCIVILSAHDESKYLIPLINLGVSQFIKKPIDYQELMDSLLKIAKALLNKTETLSSSSHNIVLDDQYHYDKENRLLLKDNDLSQNESIDPQNIRKLVSKLRKKVPTDSIESVYGVGYRIIPTF